MISKSRLERGSTALCQSLEYKDQAAVHGEEYTDIINHSSHSRCPNGFHRCQHPEIPHIKKQPNSKRICFKGSYMFALFSSRSHPISQNIKKGGANSQSINGENVTQQCLKTILNAFS